MTRCVFSRLAEADLEAIGDHIADDNPKRALSFVRELRDRCRAIVQHPQGAPSRPELGKGVRMVVFGNYLIFYRHSKGKVIIDRVLHPRMTSSSAPRLLRTPSRARANSSCAGRH